MLLKFTAVYLHTTHHKSDNLESYLNIADFTNPEKYRKNHASIYFPHTSNIQFGWAHREQKTTVDVIWLLPCTTNGVRYRLLLNRNTEMVLFKG